MNKREYHQMCKTGSLQALVATKANTQAQVLYEPTRPAIKGVMSGYAKPVIRVVRAGEVIAEREVHPLVLDVINDRTNTAAFRRAMMS